MDEFFLDEINKKIVFAILIAIGGVIFVIRRLIVSAVEKNTTLKTIERLKRRPEYARDVAENLDIPFGERSISFGNFERLKHYVGQAQKLGQYEILYTAGVSADKFLVFTTLSFVDFDVGVTGRGTDVKKMSYITFLLTYHHETQTVSVQSDLYYTSTEKFQREGFLNAVFQGT